MGADVLAAASADRAPTVSVVVRSKDEAARLRLTLISLAVQSQHCEIVVVDDGSSDETPAVLAEMKRWHRLAGRLHAHRNACPEGRSLASNRGAALASGKILLFLDGDTLASPDLVARHAAVHAGQDARMVQGVTWHLRQTRWFADPELGVPFAHEEARVAAMTSKELTRCLIDRRQILENFASVAERGQPGIYPGVGPRQLYEMEMATIIQAPRGPTTWAAASGANFSLPRDLFLQHGGFDPEMPINAHRAHALRLSQLGIAMMAATGARSYHMTHRTGWRDPLQMDQWEQHLFARHPICEVPLLSVMWAGYNDKATEQPGSIPDLQALHAAALRCAAAGGDKARSPAEVRAIHFALAARGSSVVAKPA